MLLSKKSIGALSIIFDQDLFQVTTPKIILNMSDFFRQFA